MKTLILLLTVTLTALASPSFASGLGSPYSQEVQVRGRGKPVNDWVVWPETDKWPETWIQYRNNKAQSIIWHVSEKAFLESELWRVMLENVPHGVVWLEGDKGEDGTRYWSSSDKRMAARLCSDGQDFQIAYVEWLERRNSSRQPNDKSQSDEKPPVQEGDGNNSVRPNPTPHSITPKWSGRNNEAGI
jgi:hypothetical protein